jgi:hypothetical protein
MSTRQWPEIVECNGDNAIANGTPRIQLNLSEPNSRI